MAIRGRRAGYGAVELLLLLSSRIKAFPPVVEAALLIAAGALALYWAYWEAEQAWFGDRVREAPGFSVHFIATIHTGELDRRRYFFDFRNKGGGAVALYLSAVGKPTLSITDTMGEVYTVESAVGMSGLPLGHRIYLVTEAAVWPDKSFLRIKINGRTIAERTLPFKLDLGTGEWASVIGANAHGKFNGKFAMGEFMMFERCLGVIEGRKLRHYFMKKWEIYD